MIHKSAGTVVAARDKRDSCVPRLNKADLSVVAMVSRLHGLLVLSVSVLVDVVDVRVNCVCTL